MLTLRVLNFIKGSFIKKLIGITSIILSIFLAYYSHFIYMFAPFFNSNDRSGYAGLIVAITYFIGGILTLSCETKKGIIKAIILFILGGIAGLINPGILSDLPYWSILDLVFGFLLLYYYDNNKLLYR